MNSTSNDTAIEWVEIGSVMPNKDNPRTIKGDKFKKLVASLTAFPQMMELRPLVVDADGVILGGNMRYLACKELGWAEVPILRAESLSEEQKKEFIIKDNTSFGEWDWETLANGWDEKELDAWGVDVPEVPETEKLSDLKFNDVYYTPIDVPDIKLGDCLDLDKYTKKIEYIDSCDLSEESKRALRLMAARFIRIDFESVANYYYFNASGEEKSAIERLRLVLCDAGLGGFIEDELLRIHKTLEGWERGDD